MSPARRLEILATVGHKNRLPFGTNDGEVQELGPLLRPLGWPSYQLTPRRVESDRDGRAAGSASQGQQRYRRRLIQYTPCLSGGWGDRLR